MQHLQENNVLKDYLNNLMAKVRSHSVNEIAVQGLMNVFFCSMRFSPRPIGDLLGASVRSMLLHKETVHVAKGSL